MVKLMEHNEVAFKQILSELENGNTVCYVSGTGTGKSYIAFALIEQVQGKVLYVHPKMSVKVNITEYPEYEQFADKIDFVTYNSLYKWTPDDVANYDLVLFDECHHLWSKLYGRHAIRLMSSNYDLTMFVGLTATPMTEHGSVTELFDTEVKGLYISEAIAKELMPPIDYNILCKDFSIDFLNAISFENFQEKINIEKSTNVLRDIIFKRDTSKWICFFRSIEELNSYKSEIEKLFKGFSVYTIVSSTSGAMSRLKEIARSNEKVVILTCTMLTEGVHLDGVDGVMIFRSCTSSALFQQIIGRVCKVSKDVKNKPAPIVIDCSKCAYRLLNSLIKINRDVQEESESISGGCKKTASIIDVTVNGSVKLLGEDLKRLYDINKSLGIFFAGWHYDSLLDACYCLGIDYNEVKWFMKNFNLRVEQAISSVIRKKSVKPFTEE